MKTINVTSKTTMNIPSAFTMKELQKANPHVKTNTLYQRVKVLLSEDSPMIVVEGEVKRGTKKGRTEIIYKLVDASDDSNLVRQCRSQGRSVTVAKVEAPTDVVEQEATTAVVTGIIHQIQ